MAADAKVLENLKREVLARPDNDRFRLHFAAELDAGEQRDILSDEQSKVGNPLAAFIRLQLALAAITPNDSEWMRYATQAEALLLEHEEEWTPRWYREAGIRDVEFHRGFIECVTITLPALVNYMDELFAESPIRHLDIVEFPKPNALAPLFNTLERHGHLNQIISLRIDGQKLTDEDIPEFDRKSLANLRWLSLAHNEIGAEGVRALMGESLSGLVYVDLHGNPFDPVERLIFDQGVVIDRNPGDGGVDFPKRPWFNQEVIEGLVFPPSRFSTVKGFMDDDSEAGPTEGPSGFNRQDGGARRRANPPEEEWATA